MKHYIPYIIAAVIGFFFSAAVCRLMGFESYSYGIADIFMAIVACIMVWCCRGNNGMCADIKEFFNLSRGGGRDDT